jgi:hypothetical protein
MFNPNDKFIELKKNVRELGFDGVLYSFFPRAMYLNSKTQPLIHYCNTFEPFVRHYFENNYGNNDFVIRLISERGIEPIDWWQEITNGNVTREERKVTLDAKNNFNIENGLTVPVLSGSFAMSAISVISRNGDSDYFQEIKNSHIEELQELAIDYHFYILSSCERVRFFVEPLFVNLNQTKKNVIRHLIGGKPMKTITNKYNISQRYAEKTLINIRNEFGNISTNEFIYSLGVCNIDRYL